MAGNRNASVEGAEHSKGMWDNLVKGVKAISERD